MAIIGEIRSKLSWLAVGLVGLAITAFVVSDIAGKSGAGQNPEVGEVDDITLTYREYDALYRVQEDIQKASNPSLTASELFGIRQNVWNEWIKRLIMDKQFEELGLQISEVEEYELLQGDNPHPYISQNFTNPETGVYDKTMLQMYLSKAAEIEIQNPGFQKQLENLFAVVLRDAIVNKYNNLVKNSIFMPEAFAKRNYDIKNTKYTLAVVALRGNTIADSTVAVADADYKKYYEANKYKYKQEKSADIDYVVFDVMPSADDYKTTSNMVSDIANKLATLPADKVNDFVNANTDVPSNNRWMKRSDVPSNLDTIANKPVGTVVGPYMENNTFKVARLVDSRMRSDSARASHVLISFQGSQSSDASVTRTEAEAKTLADSILTAVKANPGMMGVLALKYSSDPGSKVKGGDLDWFVDGAMVPEFNEFVFTGAKGAKGVVKTVFGYHIIDITNLKPAVNKMQIAVITKNVEPSVKTVQDAYAQASSFATNANNNIDSLVKNAEAQNLVVRTKDKMQTMEAGLPGINNSREAVRWAFGKDVKVGEVSGVIEADDKYVVVALKKSFEKGYMTLEEAKDMMKPEIIREKKSEMLCEKMKATGNITNLAELATKLEVSVDTITNVNYGSPYMQRYGKEEKVIGLATTMKVNQISQPMAGFNGAFVVMPLEIAEPIESNGNMKMEANQMSSMLQNRAPDQVYNMLKEKGNVIDLRYLFF